MRYKPVSFLDNLWISSALSPPSLFHTFLLPLMFTSSLLSDTIFTFSSSSHPSSPPPLPSLGVERPSVFQLKRWAVCVMWWTWWLLALLYESMLLVHMLHGGPLHCMCMCVYVFGLKGWGFIGITGIYMVNWCRTGYTGGFWADSSVTLRRLKMFRIETRHLIYHQWWQLII